ncbi:MAG: restriction endonuclease subunit S [Acidovorax sp.]|uniref:restriction endonuclease subunit S n=1 Tax=Acidovorax sp. TaxID=1872122 RepID=UPI0025BB0859|nr:restriction endonuclease subunit S [Acidovorax sp.]MCE1190975.1 restriction endonuclease subunit S [Acidovorax sp.]
MSNKGKKPLIPKLRFPGFQGEWDSKYLREYLSESRVSGSKGDLAKKITVKLWGGGVLAKDETIQGSVNTQYFRRSAGQFIYSKLDFLNQAFGLIPNHLDGYESTVDLPCFDFSDGLNPVFLLEYVKRKEFYEKVGEVADGSRIAKRIHAETFLDFPVLIPRPAEQKKIADCLSSLDELIAAQARKVDALKTHKKGLMQQLFPREGETQPRLRFPEFQGATGWAVEKLEYLAKRGSGHTPSKSVPEYYGGGVKWVSLADSKRLDAGFISETETNISELGIKNSSAVLHPAGTVLISRDAGVGKSAVMAVPMAVSQHFIVWNCDNQKLCNWFLYYLLQLMKPVFERIATGSTIKTIGLPFFKELSIAVPSVSEQKCIADCLTSLDALITAATQELETFKTHKKGLMQQLFPSAEAVAA